MHCHPPARFLLLFFLSLGLMGCAHGRKADWNSRIGNYSYDQAVRELGPPDKSAQLTDGTLVGDWLTFRGVNRDSSFFYPSQRYGFYPMNYEPRAPDQFLRLVFDPDGRLQSWKRLLK